MAKRRKKLSDQIRRSIETCGLTRYRISKETGIDQSNLSRFIHGEVGLSMDSLDRLADLLDLNITTDKRRQPKGR